ncbi:uncharacterized protein [Anoplolepis gracilipes]|uniref:uncharacterized protein n=1 Tax=Anoplolepis gracilipes TaxID=354296 RepID=UPI003BA23533
MAYILKAPILCRTVFHKNIIFGSITKTSYKHLSNKINIIAEQKFRLKDNISNDYKIVYREQEIINLITTISHYSGWIGVIFSAFLTGYVIYKNPPVEKEIETEFKNGGIIRPLSKLSRAVMLFFSFAVSVTLIICSKMIPFRIYYSPVEKLYKAVFVRSILGKKQILIFGEGTAVPIFKREHVGDILFKINGHTVLLDKECFPVPYVRERMIHKTN